MFDKVKKTLKGSLDSIPSPSKSREHLNFFEFFDNGQQCFAFTTEANSAVKNDGHISLAEHMTHKIF